MSFLNANKSVRAKSRSKNLFLSSTASVLSSFAFMAVAQTAHAQVIDVQTCAEIPNNPGADDAGARVDLFLDGDNRTCSVSSGDNIELEDGNQDDVTINIAAGVTLINTDTSDEDTVIFIDNSENNTRVNVGLDAILSGVNGVIFQEGDGLTLFNRGSIVGTGAQEEGVIYIDRDTDGDENLIVNTATGRIIAQDNGPAIGIETLIADGFDDAEDVGAQNDLVDFPTVRIVNQAGGLIQTTGTVSDDNDAINIAGSPGSTGGFDRECIEGAAVNCQVNLTVVNSGTIRSIFDNSGSAGITFEDDAVFNGSIANRATGLITGTRNGIRIGDVATDAGTAEHTGVVNNAGTISGTGDSSRGIDLEGDGVTIANGATGTISGVSIGIEVGAGSSSGIDHSGVNNTIVNRGTISGGNQSIDSNSAEGAITIVNAGGVLDGNVRGSVGNTDLLNITQGVTNLTNNVLQDFNVNVSPTGTLNFVGDRVQSRVICSVTVSLGFDLGDTQAVTGDVRLRINSTVAISDTSGVAGSWRRVYIGCRLDP